MLNGKDLCLPCVLCISSDAGLGDEYLKADLTPSMLHTHLNGRLRQHFQRKHGFGVRDPAAENYKSHAKRLVCRRLHSHCVKFDIAQEFVSVSQLNMYSAMSSIH